jgi:hypothetical protein
MYKCKLCGKSENLHVLISFYADPNQGIREQMKENKGILFHWHEDEMYCSCNGKRKPVEVIETELEETAK